MSQDDTGSSNGRRRPAPPPRNPQDRARYDAEEAFRKKQQQFEREEGPADELRQMGMKLLRRVFAEQAHAKHAVSDYGAELQRRLLLRALNNDEDRYRMVVERMERSRALSQEHMRKAAALQMDYLSSLLDVQRGYVDGLIDRWRNRSEADSRSSKFVERLVGLRDEDIQHATLKSAVLVEMVKDMLKGQDPYFEKLSEAERKHLLEFALGTRADPPDFMSTLFGDVDVRRPRDVPPRPHGQGNRVVEAVFPIPQPPKDKRPQEPSGEPPLGEKVPEEPSEKKASKKETSYRDDLPRIWVDYRNSDVPFDSELPLKGEPSVGLAQAVSPLELEGTYQFDDDGLEDRALSFFIGPCISEPPRGWPRSKPWPDGRFSAKGLLHVEVPSVSGDAQNSVYAPQEPGDDGPPRLRALASVEGRVHLTFKAEEFLVHARDVAEMAKLEVYKDWFDRYGWSDDKVKEPLALPYRVSVTFPELRRTLWVRFQVIWVVPPSMSDLESALHAPKAGAAPGR